DRRPRARRPAAYPRDSGSRSRSCGRTAAPHRRARRRRPHHPREAGPPVGRASPGRGRAAQHHKEEAYTMREVDFRYLKAALESLSSSTDLVLARGQVRAVLSRQASPYASHRGVRFELVHEPPDGDVLLAANQRKILLVGCTERDVWRAADAIGRDGRPYPGETIGWDGPWADWCIAPVPSGVRQLRGLVRVSHEYGIVDYDWMTLPLLHVAFLVPVVMEWDENGRPVFSWPDRPSEPESERVDQ